MGGAIYATAVLMRPRIRPRSSLRKDGPPILVVVGCAAVVAGWLSSARGLELHPVLYPEGAVLIALGLYRIFRRFIHTPQAD